MFKRHNLVYEKDAPQAAAKGSPDAIIDITTCPAAVIDFAIQSLVLKRARLVRELLEKLYKNRRHDTSLTKHVGEGHWNYGLTA
jgi:hypothetical protein